MASNVISQFPPRAILRPADLCNDPKRPERGSYLNVSRPTLWRWVKTGVFPAPVRMGGSSKVVGWPVEVVRAWIEEQHNGGRCA